MELNEKLTLARRWIDEGDYVRVISHHDVDGISAAAIILNFLKKKGKKFHCSLLKNVNSDITAGIGVSELSIVADMGSSCIGDIEKLNGRTIILDHHLPERESRSERVLEINSHLHNINGSQEACASTMAYMFANDPALISFLISGALGDRQGTAFVGLNNELVHESIDNKIIKREFGLTMDCYDRTNLQRMIETSSTPFFKNMSGRSAKKFVETVGASKGERVNSVLMAQLIKQGCRDDVVEDLLGYKYLLPFMNMDSQELLSLLNVCDGLDMAEKGLAMALGNRKSYEEIKTKRVEYYTKALKGLLKLEEEGVSDKGHIQWFYNSDLGMSGFYCGIGMRYLFDQEKPALGLTKVKDHTRVSSRGTKYLISRGLNLAEALKKAARESGGDGGGHDIAAGASIPSDREEFFLNKIEEIVGAQLR